MLAFLGIALPLSAFSELAEEIHEADPLGFDEPVLRWAESSASPALDEAMLLASQLGYTWGVVPLAVLVFGGLLATARIRRALYFALAVGGSALLNLVAKAVFVRERPSLWLSIAPEHSYSFPSGHAMGAMSLAAAIVLLLWFTRWRWPALVLGLGFTLWVGGSRVYLGVHYPSDILAGWAAALAWVSAVYLVVRPNHRGRRPAPDAAEKD
ncbi:MAG TPA: phosphatase PAP2 family protein [Arenimonas sp.]|nr:phosphatase PAP2 family protein [Arenimonas sp.]